MISQTPHNPKAKLLKWAKDMNEKMLNITTHQKIQTKPLRLVMTVHSSRQTAYQNKR